MDKPTPEELKLLKQAELQAEHSMRQSIAAMMQRREVIEMAAHGRLDLENPDVQLLVRAMAHTCLALIHTEDAKAHRANMEMRDIVDTDEDSP